jgi:hypothetical protein
MKDQSSITRLRKKPRAFLEHVVLLNSQVALLTDLSLSGIRVQGAEALRSLKPNQKAQLSWKILPNMKALNLELKCVWCKENSAGLSFKSLDSKTRFLIRALVRYHRHSDS